LPIGSENNIKQLKAHIFLLQRIPCRGHSLQTHRTAKILETPEYTSKDIELHSLQKQMLHCLNNGTFQKGLRIALEAIDHFPEKPTLTHSWTIDFYMSLGRKEKAMKMLEQGFSRGAWWSPKYLMSETKELENHPAFSKILKQGEKRFNEEKQHAQAELIVRTPKKYSNKKMYPLLLVLHGAYSNNFDSEPYWLSILDKKQLFLASLQSSQIVSDHHHVWDDQDTALKDVENAYSTLKEHYRIDNSKVILGGISHGAEIALITIFSNRVPAKGFISAIPSVGAFTQQFVKNNSFQNKEKGLKGCIIAGEKDPRYNKQKAVNEFLNKKGIPTQFHSYPELGHSIPDNFDQVLAKSIKFTLHE
jgi:predicted esterase